MGCEVSSGWVARFWRRVGFAWLAAAIAAAAAATAQAAEPVTLAVSRTPLSLPVYVAQSQGYFAAEGLDARLIDCIGGHRCMQLMLDGQADVATAGELPVVFNAFKRQDHAVIATITTTADDVKLVARGGNGAPAPKALQDLAGKRVGVVAGTSSQYVLDLALLTSGVDPRGVTVLLLQPEEMLPAMRAGKVDAVSIWEPFAHSILNGLGGEASVLPSAGGYLGTFNLVAQRRLLVPRDAMLQHLLRAIDRAERLIQQHPAEAQRLLREQLQLAPKSAEWACKGLSYRLGLDQSLITTMEGQARWALREGHASGELPNFLGLVHAGPLRQAVPNAAGSLK